MADRQPSAISLHPTACACPAALPRHALPAAVRAARSSSNPPFPHSTITADLSATLPSPSRYINKEELGALCAILNTRMSDAELGQAMERLDTDKSGRIELFEFKNWWLGKVVFGEDSAQAGMDDAVKQAGKNRLLQAKLQRKQAEADAQLLANRIALLRQEEAKAWKKIQQTKIRATEILNLREDNEKRAQNKAENNFMTGENTRKAQEQRFVQKQRDKAMRQRAQAEVIRERQLEVKEVRKMRRVNEIEKQRQRQADQERARYNREVVRAHEDRLKENKLREIAQAQKKNQDDYNHRVLEEAKRTKNKEVQVSKMEKEEMELIQRLQNAQMLQKEAYEQLEGALVGTMDQ